MKINKLTSKLRNYILKLRLFLVRLLIGKRCYIQGCIIRGQIEAKYEGMWLENVDLEDGAKLSCKVTAPFHC